VFLFAIVEDCSFEKAGNLRRVSPVRWPADRLESWLAPEVSLVKLSRLTIQKFRSVRPETVLKFRNGSNVVVGRNGSGKTTLLNLISAAVTMDFSPFRAEPYDVRFDAKFDDDEVEAHVVAALTETGEFQRTLDLKVKPGADEADNLNVRVVDDEMTIERRGQFIYQGPAAFDATKKPGMATLLDLIRQVATRGGLDQVRTLRAASRLARARRFDESAEFFHSIFGDEAEIYLMPSETGPVGVSFVVPDWLIEEVGRIAASGLPKPFDVDLTTFKSGEQLLKLLGATVGIIRVDHLDGEPGQPQRFRCTLLALKRASGMVHHEQLSFGQKRLVALYWYLAGSPSTAIIDELTNGFDYSWVDLSLSELGTRQSFLSASNPLLIERLRFDSGEDVRRAITTCHQDEHGALVWEQFDEKRASAFYRAWKGGPQEFSETLRLKGWW
jgi:energy-coupling factor transporter ATP-binding protein EcfA2